jgi:Holliday junction resolvasome RuvABC ATP-dependent DNA helicase subunit
MNETSRVQKVVPDLKAFTDSLFADVIGQTGAKREFKFYLHDYIESRRIPNTMIIAPRGQGKTLLATEIGKGLYKFNDQGEVDWTPSISNPNVLKPVRKSFELVNCSTLKNVKQFINGLLVKKVVDKDVTVFFDEASEIPHDIAMALLTMLPVNRDKSEFAYDEYVVELDFKRQSFIFATTEPHKVFHALMDRLERITLQDYNQSELAQILRRSMDKDIQVEDDTLLDVATVLRGNARAAEKMAAKISTYARTNKKFTRQAWEKLVNVLSIAPLGLNKIEIEILRHLAMNSTGTSLTRLSAKTGMSREALMKTEEIYLQKNDLMEITTGGRQITAKGLDYLKALDAKALVA